MLEISEDFFKEEYRDGFYIPSSMKKTWAIQLGVLSEILDLARKYDIPIWMDCGSLLGTIRHKGYIPWDDDIDLCLIRDDYMKFLQILKEELPANRKVYSFYTTNDYHLPKAFVCNRENIDIGISSKEEAITQSMFNCPYCLGVDLFPLDYIPTDQAYWEQLSKLYIIAYNIGIDYDSYLQSGELDSFLNMLKSTLNLSSFGDNSRSTVWKIAEAISTMTKKDEASWITWYPEYAMGGSKRRRSISAYSGTVIMDFEMIKVPVPIGYEEVIRVLFGEDYMTPIRGTAGHNYPLYKNQEMKILYYNRIGQTGDIF
ncbi:lipopolysaccharide cholinephosphotransferase [Butyrivibrio sp. INlla18]|nr:lipopolysaccharide cholinephosphotransferase [Butyrivibrio sp. INlla18]